MIVFGQIFQNALPIFLLFHQPCVLSLRRLYSLILRTILGATARQCERHGGIVGKFNLIEALPSFDELVIPSTGDGVGLLVSEFLHAIGKQCISLIFRSRDKLVAVQFESALLRQSDLVSRFPILFQHFDFLDNRLCHVVGMAVFIINVDKELQIQGGDVLRKAGQGLCRRQSISGQLVKGTQVGRIDRQVLILCGSILFNRHLERQLNGSAFDIGQVGGALPDLGDVDQCLFPAGIGYGSAVGSALGQCFSLIRIGCLIVVRVHRLTDKIDILPALFIIGRQCKVRWQILHCGTGKGDGFFIVLIFQMIRQKNVLISACFGCFPVDDLGSQVLIIHRINAGISVIRYRIAPQCHNDLGALG